MGYFHSPLPGLFRTDAKAGDEARLRELETEIDRIVYRLFDLTPEEIQIVEGSRK